MVMLVPAVDLLFEAVASRGHVCVGLDTSAEYVPVSERSRAQNDAEAVLNFNKAVIDASFDAAACFKVQIAYYEEMGVAGLRTYSETLKYIHKKGGIVIADIKRGDIADTAKRYVRAHFSGDFEADFVTISPYMGMDSVEPWLSEAGARGKGAFVLMRTSNPGMRDFQFLGIRDSCSSSERDGNLQSLQTKTPIPDPSDCKSASPIPTRLYHIVGEKLSALANVNKGKHGYGLFGAVVGCTEREEAAEIRQRYPGLFFLIPGYGAQGGAAADAAVLLREGNGGIVNASRSIITAWKNDGDNEKADNALAAEAAFKAAVKMRDDIRKELSKCAQLN